MGNHHNSELQKDWIKFGGDKFKYEILEEIEHKENNLKSYNKEVKELEKMYIEALSPFNNRGYNQK